MTDELHAVVAADQLGRVVGGGIIDDDKLVVPGGGVHGFLDDLYVA
ncbi:MAG: hypothetical protein L6427_11710 [Actinomycetia bacterium]|nr:hypothetical protein [Actinomycetes bacterium]